MTSFLVILSVLKNVLLFNWWGCIYISQGKAISLPLKVGKSHSNIAISSQYNHISHPPFSSSSTTEIQLYSPLSFYFILFIGFLSPLHIQKNINQPDKNSREIYTNTKSGENLSFLLYWWRSQIKCLQSSIMETIGFLFFIGCAKLFFSLKRKLFMV